jgi:hypothetical protein
MSTKRSTAKPPKPIRSWRDTPDCMHRSYTQRPNPESLHPDADTVLDAVGGNRIARAIVDAYAFRHPVTVVTDLEALCSQ